MHKIEIDAWFVNKARQIRDGRLNPYRSLDPRRTALVVVDMQTYFVSEGMPSYIPEAASIIPNINRLAHCARSAGALVAWVQTEAPPDAQDWANRKEAVGAERWRQRQMLLAKGSGGFAICAGCELDAKDEIAIKTRYSAFIPHPSELHSLLERRGIDTILITGVATSTCCESTARDASMWGYRTILVSDANADQTDALHNHTLGKFLVTFGDVRSTEEVIGMLARAAPSATAAE